MSGATADPWLNTISPPKSANTINIGISQYFLLVLKNLNNSRMKLTINVS